MTDFELQTTKATARMRNQGWSWINHGAGKWLAYNFRLEQAVFRSTFRELLDAMELETHVMDITAEPGSGDSIDSRRVRK